MTLKVITLLAGTMEVTTFVLLCLGLRVFQNPIHRPEFRILGPILHLFISLLRMLVLLPLLSVLFWSTRYLHVQPAAERTPLLASEATSGPSATDTLPVPSQDGNGMTNASQDRPKVDEKKPSPSGWEMVRMLWKIAPYLWPARVLYLQVFAICAIVLMVARRAITVLTQLAFAQLIDALVFGTCVCFSTCVGA
ncbi:hypothetical protein CALVIDRAFT_305762 [Calocera viscosa TUFC12733]|uniref:Uncharacterized protein n=1 Tax=Calocera viscosa (strain TUFC12733) TaxID=1330018 RepID=A0A167IGL7_CALVF|nr:hypothetical protein CALVIDRAFT_305762 [Calocera viscosa TUFC12733]